MMMITIEIYQRVLLARVAAAIAVLWFSVFVAGCAANLKPAPQARTARNNEPAAFSEVAGVRVVVYRISGPAIRQTWVTW